MIFRKLMNARKDLTETRNKARAINRQVGEVAESAKSIEECTKSTAERVRSIEKKTNSSVSRIKSVEQLVMREFQRRDIWALKEAEIKRLANGRKIWVIKCPAPDSESKFRGGKYGDYAYCMMMKSHLEKLGFFAVIDMYEDWYCNVGADVVLVMRGVHDYHPDRRDPKTRYVLWIVSHPEMISEGECDLYDLVLVDSEPLAGQLRENSSVPVEPFYVLTDTEVFYPEGEEDDERLEYNRVFVGNTRGIMRDCVKWCHENQIELDVWGEEWEKFYPDSPYIHLHGQLEYGRIADIYRKSKVVINDHYDEMLETGMLNNRFPEVLLCGKPMICDWSESFERQFGEIVLFYRDEDEFIKKVHEADAEYDKLRKAVMEHQKELQSRFDIDRGLAVMEKLIENRCDQN